MTAGMVTTAALDFAEGDITPAAVAASTAAIPRSCICTWRWTGRAWHLEGTFLACPWHGRQP